MPITPSLRHCSNKYKLAREGEKDKAKVNFFFFFFCSQVELKEMSFYILYFELLYELLYFSITFIAKSECRQFYLFICELPNYNTFETF